MAKDLIQNTGVNPIERIALFDHFYKKARFFAMLLIGAALFVAVFAISAVWSGRSAALAETKRQAGTGTAQDDLPVTSRTDEQGEPSRPMPSVSEGATAVRDADLSASWLGDAYINNETEYVPNVSDWSDRLLSVSPTEEPLVLILHTHTSEGYIADGVNCLEGDVGDATYSDDPTQNVIAVGAVLARTLNANGVSAIHCTVEHDDPTLGGSYARAMESIRFFLTHYPSIQYVIDVHRDSILDSDGTYLRTVSEISGERYAQVMAVVGCDEGTENERWVGNLALAQGLRTKLNSLYPALVRPTTLKNATYNQTLASYSLLLEIGTGANSAEEACRSAVSVGEALAAIIKGQ